MQCVDALREEGIHPKNDFQVVIAVPVALVGAALMTKSRFLFGSTEDNVKEDGSLSYGYW